jgi:transaldolase
MKFFVDTASLQEILGLVPLGIVDGVTTNPTLLAKEGGDHRRLLKQICKAVQGPVSAEVVATDAPGMIREGKSLASLDEHIAVKVPFGREGVKACRTLADEGIRVNMTLVFSPTQALLAAKVGATFVSPFVGRLDDIATAGMELIEQIVGIYDNYEFTTEVLVASVRHPIHVVEAALMGADICTCPASVIEALFRHPLTDIGLARFLADWENAKAETAKARKAPRGRTPAGRAARGRERAR